MGDHISGIVGTERNHHPVVNVCPFGMMIHLADHLARANHEFNGLLEGLKLKSLGQFVVLVFPVLHVDQRYRQI